ncbi:PAS domain S-box-containing protein [Lewinella aquimaris]|uniref:PAS domain S-box-containing protein n=1 Tax=Neolewinella aquimaris TaxID=1835722 RepID=A0A840E4W0_9BACT|nr:PAS domain-containing protein [Neolewinella aquimaris]MBB4078772.1 PAS domain S-box-containing protein [Neolewinella aquimaris]
MYPLTPPQILALANRVVGNGSSDLLCANLEGQLRYANSSACKTLGYNFSELVQKKIADYSPNYSQDIWDGHCQRTISNGSDEIYTYHENCSGTRYPVVIYSVPHIISETSEQLICSLVKDAQNSYRYRQMLEMVEHSHRIGSFDYNLRDQSILVSDNLLAIMGTRDPDTLKPDAFVERLSREHTSTWNAHMIDLVRGYHRMEETLVVSTAGGRQSLMRVTLWSVLNGGTVSGIRGFYEILDESEKERMVSLEENQRQHIIRALRYTNGRVTGPNGAGKLLDINGKTLFARMKKLNIHREDYTNR